MYFFNLGVKALSTPTKYTDLDVDAIKQAQIISDVI